MNEDEATTGNFCKIIKIKFGIVSHEQSPHNLFKE